jgi:hypothetical protein
MKKATLFLLLLLPLSGFASHFMGGEITWQCLANGRFRFVMKLYRECNGITFNNNETINVANAPISSIFMNLYPGGNPLDGADGSLDGKTDISPDCWDPAQEIHCSPMPTVPNTGAVEEWYYTSDMANPTGVLLSGVPPTAGWIFSYSSGSRNPSTNITNASSLNWFLRAVMYPYQGYNTNPCFDNSPTFAESPSPVIGVGYPFTYNHNATDKELDSLTYDWAPALIDVTTPVPYAPGFSYNNPLPDSSFDLSNVAAVMNAYTGEISYTSFTAGAFVTVTKVTAYRKGIKIAEIFREMQMVLLPNQYPNNPPQLSPPFYNPVSGLYDLYVDTVYAGETVDFDITSLDLDLLPNGNPQTLILEASGQDFGAGFSNSTVGCLNPPCATLNPPPIISAMLAVATHFHWQTSCDHLPSYPSGSGYGPPYYVHNFVIKVYDNNCPGPGMTIATISIVVKTKPVLANPELKCVETDSAGNVTLNWVPVLDTENSFNLYMIYRSVSASGPFYAIDSTFNMFQSTYTDFGVNPGWGTYYYYIKTFSSGCYGRTSPPGSGNILSTTKLNLILQPGNPLILNWGCTDSVVPVNPMYFLYAKCPGQSWQMFDSAQQNFYTLSGTDTIYNGCQFRVFIRDSSGCTGFSQAITYNLGIDKVDYYEAKCFDFYPNPSGDKIYIKVYTEKEKPQIEMYDVFGRMHKLQISKSIENGIYSSDISSFSTGVYYLKIEGCSGIKKLLLLR